MAGKLLAVKCLETQVPSVGRRQRRYLSARIAKEVRPDVGKWDS